jgi:TolB-like protein/Tfp pilus assembly protein PilF
MEGPPQSLNDAEVTKGDMLVTRYPIDVARFVGSRAHPCDGSRAKRKQSIRGLVWCRRAFQRILNRHMNIGVDATRTFRRMGRHASERQIKQGFRFGRFALDVRARELQKDGVRIRLQDQPFEVLSMLLRQAGEVLTRDELRRQLWPDGTFVDFEHGLNAAVKRLRTALGDNAETPRFVETVHRRGYRFIAPVERIEAEASEQSLLARVGGISTILSEKKRRLAVLPFAEVGDTDGRAYFTEGLTEEMITALGRLCTDRLGVVARTSSMLVRHNAKTVREIGQALRVDFILEGSVRREADRVRIAAQLIETEGETQLWAESYERHLSDCFFVQSEVAAEIARSLALELLPDSRVARRCGTRHVAAHQAYLKGRYHWNKSAGEGLLQAVAYFEQALALDPEFAAAHSALGRAQVAAADYYVREPRIALEAGRVAASRALEIDPTDSEAHLTLAEVRKLVDWDWDGAEHEYGVALSFNPSSESVYRHYGLFLAVRGRPAEAAVAADRACDLDPLCLVVNTSAAWVRYLAGDYDGTMERCRHTMGMDADFAPAPRLLAAALFQSGRVDEALAGLEALTRAEKCDPVSLAWLAHLLGTQGERTGAEAALERLSVLAGVQYVSAYHRALAHTGIGNVDAALSLLSEACDSRDPSIVNLAAEPRFEPLRSKPEYQELVDRVGLRRVVRR